MLDLRAITGQRFDGEMALSTNWSLKDIPFYIHILLSNILLINILQMKLDPGV